MDSAAVVHRRRTASVPSAPSDHQYAPRRSLLRRADVDTLALDVTSVSSASQSAQLASRYATAAGTNTKSRNSPSRKGQDGSTPSASQPQGDNKHVKTSELFELASQGRGSELVAALSKKWADSRASSSSAAFRKRSISGSGDSMNVDALADSRGNSLLHTACSHGRAEVAQVLIQMGATVTKHSKSETTFIPRSSASGAGSDPASKSEPSRDTGACTDSRNAGSRANPVVTVSHGAWTPLHYAAKSGSRSTIRCVLKTFQQLSTEQAQEALSAQSADGCTALHCIFEHRSSSHRSKPHRSRRSGSSTVECLRLLLDHGCNPDTATATRRRWCTLLDLPPVFVKSRLTSGLTALHCAVDKADSESMKVLLASGCDVNARTTYEGVCDGGMTALHFACEQLSVDCVHVLLEAGANPNLTDDHGTAPLHVTLMTPTDVLTNAFGDYNKAMTSNITDYLDEEDKENIAEARCCIVRMLLEAGADRHAVARQRPTSDPCHVTTKGTVSLEDGVDSGGENASSRLILSDMAAHESCLGGKEVLQLLGTCFVQPASLQCLSRRAVARHLHQPVLGSGYKTAVKHYAALIDRLLV